MGVLGDRGVCWGGRVSVGRWSEWVMCWRKMIKYRREGSGCHTLIFESNLKISM